MDEKATFINAHVIYLFWAFTGCFILKNWLDALHRLTTCLTTHLSNRNAAETQASWLDVCFPSVQKKIKAFSPKFSFTSQIKRQVKRTFASNVFVNKNIPMTAMIRQAPNLKFTEVAFQSFSALLLCCWPFSVCLCESERGISPFGPPLLVPSEQPGQSTQAQFGGSQHHLNCKENRKSTSGSVLTLW